MVIVGEWRTCDDGVARPTVEVVVGDPAETQLAAYFLVDRCADHRPFSLLVKLGDHALGVGFDVVLAALAA